MARGHAQPGLAACAGLLACGILAAQPRTIAHLDSRAVDESSGVTASRQNPGIYWTHNDSGGSPTLFAFNRTGHVLGRWTVPGAQNVDWEDIAIGSGPVPGRWYIYIGDIGNNLRNRRQVVVYRVQEPVIDGSNACRTGCKTVPAEALRFRYPDRIHDAETLMVHPKSGDLYIISKSSGDDFDTIVFVVRAQQLSTTRPVVMTKLGTLDIPDMLFKRLAGGLTGGDISPDGRRVVFCDYVRIYEAVLPTGAKFDEIWSREFTATMIGLGQMEGVCYAADGKSVIATNEASPCPVIEMVISK